MPNRERMRRAKIADKLDRRPTTRSAPKPFPVVIDETTGLPIPARTLPTIHVRTSSMRQIRQSMARVVQAGLRGELDLDIAKSAVWMFSQLSGLLREELQTERLEAQLAELRELLRERPELQREIDVDRIRRIVRGEDDETEDEGETT